MDVIRTIVEYAVQIFEIVFRVVEYAANVYKVALQATYEISPRTYLAFIIISLGGLVALFVVVGELVKPVQGFFKPKPKDKPAPSSFNSLLGCVTHGFWLILLAGLSIIFLFSFPFNNSSFDPPPTLTPTHTWTPTPTAPTSTPIATPDGDWTNPGAERTPTPTPTPTITSSTATSTNKTNIQEANSQTDSNPVQFAQNRDPIILQNDRQDEGENFAPPPNNSIKEKDISPFATITSTPTMTPSPLPTATWFSPTMTPVPNG